jgi:hypothetical protein
MENYVVGLRILKHTSLLRGRSFSFLADSSAVGGFIEIFRDLQESKSGVSLQRFSIPADVA